MFSTETHCFTCIERNLLNKNERKLFQVKQYFLYLKEELNQKSLEEFFKIPHSVEIE